MNPTFTDLKFPAKVTSVADRVAWIKTYVAALFEKVVGGDVPIYDKAIHEYAVHAEAELRAYTWGLLDCFLTLAGKKAAHDGPPEELKLPYDPTEDEITEAISNLRKANVIPHTHENLKVAKKKAYLAKCEEAKRPDLKKYADQITSITPDEYFDQLAAKPKRQYHAG